VFTTYFVLDPGHGLAQRDATGNATSTLLNTIKLTKIEDLLKADLTATLAGLAVAAAAFLQYKTYGDEDLQTLKQQDWTRSHYTVAARKDFIISFFLLIVGTILISADDIVKQVNILTIQQEFPDTVGKYGLFYGGLFFLVRAAYRLYRSVTVSKDTTRSLEAIKGDVVTYLNNHLNKWVSVKEVATVVIIDNTLAESILDQLEKDRKNMIEKGGHFENRGKYKAIRIDTPRTEKDSGEI